jgi:hypothetical protein
MVAFKLGPDARRAVWMMRILLVLAAVEQEHFTRTFHSFGVYRWLAHWIIEFDASLEGIGIIWLRVMPDGSEVAVGCFAVNLEHLGMGMDSSFQNCCEFMAVTLGVRGLAQRGVQGVGVHIRGDSMSALCWADKEAFHSDLVGNASMVFVAGNIRSKIEVVRREHWPAARNHRADHLSRGGTRSSLLELDRAVVPILDERNGEITNMWDGVVDGPRLTEELEEWDLDEQRILSLCSPTLLLEGEESFFTFWENVGKEIPTVTD